MHIENSHRICFDDLALIECRAFSFCAARQAATTVFPKAALSASLKWDDWENCGDESSVLEASHADTSGSAGDNFVGLRVQLNPDT